MIRISRDDNRSSYAPRARTLNELRDSLARRGNDQKIRCFRQITDARIAGETVDLSMARVEQVNRTRKARITDIVENRAPETARAGACPGKGERTRAEKAFQVMCGHGLAGRCACHRSASTPGLQAESKTLHCSIFDRKAITGP